LQRLFRQRVGERLTKQHGKNIGLEGHRSANLKLQILARSADIGGRVKPATRSVPRRRGTQEFSRPHRERRSKRLVLLRKETCVIRRSACKRPERGGRVEGGEGVRISRFENDLIHSGESVGTKTCASQRRSREDLRRGGQRKSILSNLNQRDGISYAGSVSSCLNGQKKGCNQNMLISSS